ncbi:hypothetical protein WISP_107368 [Willisornis vidua]|uniref:Uncharacterized protein n=1 Tax=Willisornis vidua TaxID=1566151 RepID=A0ABQ9D2G8_9PASS|nr:hypothetical protein WISP_107368 [Willisornis vidua]
MLLSADVGSAKSPAGAGLTQKAGKPDSRGLGRSRALPVVAPSSSLAFPVVMGKIKGRSFCPGHITGDVIAPNLSQSRTKVDSSFTLSTAAGNMINREAKVNRGANEIFPSRVIAGPVPLRVLTETPVG